MHCATCGGELTNEDYTETSRNVVGIIHMHQDKIKCLGILFQTLKAAERHRDYGLMMLDQIIQANKRIRHLELVLERRNRQRKKLYAKLKGVK